MVQKKNIIIIKKYLTQLFMILLDLEYYFVKNQFVSEFVQFVLNLQTVLRVIKTCRVVFLSIFYIQVEKNLRN